MIRPSSGRALVAGFDVVEQPLEVKRRIGCVPESGTLFDNLTPAEYLDLVGCLHHLDAATIASRTDELLDLFALGDVRDQRMTEFSKGMRQKVAISAALLHRPDVLVLDEPLDGLDAHSAMIVKDLLRKLAARGKTIFFCSHILEVVERICTRIVIINNGRQIADGTPREIATATGMTTLEEAFVHLTGTRDVEGVTRDFLAALEKA
jgi:ABC-2 type transport system ATP-binding protein